MEKININGIEVAIFIPKISTDKRIDFLTNANDQLQIAAFSMKSGQTIQPHMHLEQKRELLETHEIIFIQEGILIVNFYKDPERDEIFKSIEMHQGDLIYLKGGIHGFTVGEDCKFIEIKQGPFINGKDKIKLYEYN